MTALLFLGIFGIEVTAVNDGVVDAGGFEAREGGA